MSIADLFDRAGGITRRRLAQGAAGAAGAGIAAIALAGCSGTQDKSVDGEPQVVTDDSKVVNVLDDYESKDLGVNAVSTWTLPLGTLLWHCEGGHAAAMMAPESAVHVNTLGTLSLSTGTLDTLMDTPTLGGAYAFFDARCSDGVYAWVEIDYLEGAWTLLARPFSGGAFTGDAVKLDTGSKNWEPPKFTCTGTSVIWLKMPLATGSRASSPSQCYLWSVGADKGTSLWESAGRFATPPRVAAGALTISPRVRSGEGTYYGMTAIDLKDGAHNKLDQLVLPASVKPFEAVYTGREFIFSIEAAYDAAGSLGKMGTFIGREGGPYVFFGREPIAQTVFNGTKVLVKTQAAHYAVDTDARQYEGVSSPDRSIGLGDMLASEGEAAQPLVYATIRDAQGIPASVTARLLTL